MNSWLISGITFASGILIFLFLFLRNKWKVSGKDIQEYEEGRDKLTFRKKEEPKESGWNLPLGNLIGGFIVILVGASLAPEVVKQLNTACSAEYLGNITTSSSQMLCSGASGTLISITGILFVIVVMASAIGIISQGLRNSGVM